MKKIVIGICTYNRNELLGKCLSEMNHLNIPNDTFFEVVIVDNSFENIAKDFVENLRKDIIFPIHYFTCFGNGIASVRNEVLKQSLALNPDYIAFIDDDEMPSNDWLINLYNLLINSDADIVSGPVVSNFVDDNFQNTKVPDFISKNIIFNLHNKRSTGKICSTCSTNNVLLNASILKDSGLKFDESFKKMSGEDIGFFGKLHKLGYRILWCKEGYVIENVLPERSNIKYICKRNYNNGYLKIFIKKKDNTFKPKHLISPLLNLGIFFFALLLSTFWGRKTFVDILGKIVFNCGALVSIFKERTFNLYK